jgi:hypothetical protein
MRDRRLRPTLERVEARELLSAILALLASQPPAAHGHFATVHANAGGGSGGNGGSPQTSSGQMQGPIGNATDFFVPTGNPTPHEQARQQFQFTIVGPYLIAPGRFDNQQKTIFIRGAGTSTYFLHGDGQLGATVPVDPTIPASAQLTFFDRNINANSVFGFDLAADRATGFDARGRPAHFQLSTDVNISSGLFVESLSKGTVDIRYVPSRHHIPGVFEQGTAYVLVRGQAYTLGTANILRNTDINH